MKEQTKQARLYLGRRELGLFAFTESTLKRLISEWNRQAGVWTYREYKCDRLLDSEFSVGKLKTPIVLHIELKRLSAIEVIGG